MVEQPSVAQVQELEVIERITNARANIETLVVSKQRTALRKALYKLSRELGIEA